jgi:hypothetical protein
MESEGLLLCPQGPAIGPCVKFSPHLHIPWFFKINFNVLASALRFSKRSLPFKVCDENFLYISRLWEELKKYTCIQNWSYTR